MSETQQAEEAYRPLPVPENVPDPPESHFRLGNVAVRWWYTDAEGRRLFCVVRFEDDQGNKTGVLPQTWDGAKWRWKAWPEPRPLYGQEFGLGDTTRPVVLVEGEKSADALQYALGEDFAVMTWPGGSKAVAKVDWSPLLARDVILWPDADDGGIAAMVEVSSRLRLQLCQCITITPRNRPKGWDAADAPPAERQSLVRAAFADLQARKALEESAAARRNEVWLPWADESAPVADPHDLPPYEGGWRHVKANQPIASIPNLRTLLQHYRIRPRVNAIEKAPQYHRGEGTAYSRALSATDVISLCRVNGMATGEVRDVIARIAAEDEYNPILEWLDGRKWDGLNRLPALCESLGIADDFSAMLLRRWLCTAIALAVDVEPPKAQGMLVLQGKQGLGKSRWLAALTGGRWFREGLTLDVQNKDSVWQAITAWIVELGELDATFRKTDVAHLKAFLTKGRDEFRRPYEAETFSFPRRTIFAATVNPDTFLHDPTGSRRFWVIRCTRITPDHGIDMQQVWLQALAMRQAGEPTYLTSQENEILAQRNENHTESTAEQDLLHAKYDFSKPKTGGRMSAAEVAIELGYERPTTATSRVVGQALRKALGDPIRIRGRMVWQMPMPRTEADRAIEGAASDDPSPY